MSKRRSPKATKRRMRKWEHDSYPRISPGQFRALNAQTDEQLRLELDDVRHEGSTRFGNERGMPWPPSPDMSGPRPGHNRPLAPGVGGSQGEADPPRSGGLTATGPGANAHSRDGQRRPTTPKEPPSS